MFPRKPKAALALPRGEKAIPALPVTPATLRPDTPCVFEPCQAGKQLQLNLEGGNRRSKRPAPLVGRTGGKRAEKADAFLNEKVALPEPVAETRIRDSALGRLVQEGMREHRPPKVCRTPQALSMEAH
jgi:hypothetical protein